MTTTDPYRASPNTNCPVCAAPLATSLPGQLWPCAAGCGEWASAAVVDNWWGEVIDIGLPAAKALWQPPPPPRRCVICQGPMMWISNEAWTVHRCRQHGAWFERDGRVGFESAHTAAIEQHRWAGRMAAAHAAAQARELAEAAAARTRRFEGARHELRDLIARAITGEGAAIEALADRIARLESLQPGE